MDGQVGQAHLVQGPAQVEHALLTLPAQLHVAPQEGEALQDESVAPGHVLLGRHVEEGEAHVEAVQRVFRLVLQGLDILA